jgi:hypothetical protein
VRETTERCSGEGWDGRGVEKSRIEMKWMREGEEGRKEGKEPLRDGPSRSFVSSSSY